MGGMGAVYRALDTKLNRTVAIKVLPQEWVSNHERRRRFVQEAQAASALDHPNIVTIHDITEADGRHFIVMQYVKGRTLRELVREGLEVSKSLDYAVQMADGLASAHAAGIVHRDLKPENVLVDEKGRVKILDFGIAKLTEPADVHEAETRDQVPLTKEGHILGTAAYMSPEQAQGKKVDARSDIFAFGSVFYEMLTGQPAFEGDNIASVMAAIIRDDPAPVTKVVPNAPRGIDGFLRRTLEKDPANRFSSMEEVKTELGTIQSLLQAPRRVLSIKLRWLGASAVLVIMGLSFYALQNRLLPSTSPPLPPTRTVPVTSYPGVESYPAISPDGSRVAFLMNDDVYVQNTSGGNALQLTDRSTKEISLTWTPDGQRITFLRSSESGLEIYSVPVLGGAETRITGLGGIARNVFGLSWSPDGKNLAYVDSDTPDVPQAIFLLDMETGERTRLTFPPPESIGDLYPVFSPDGGRIAFVRMATTHIVRDIYTKDLKGEEEVRLTSEGGNLSVGFDWSTDGRSIIYSLQGRLYRIAASGGEPHPVEGVEGRAGWLSVSRNGTFLVYAQSLDDWNIWRAPGSRSQSGEPKRFFGSTRLEHTPVYSPDGTRIAFVSNRTGGQEIWICDSHGASPMRLTALEDHADRPSWSPDGEEIVFDASREGQTDVYRVSAAGGVPLRLTNEPSVDAGASWSRNGEWIYFISDRSGSRQIWKMTAAGEKATQLSQNGGWQPTESFDGAFVYFSKTEGGDGIWRLPSSGGDEEPVLDGVYPHRWSLTEDGIAYINEVTQEFELFDFASGKRTHFSSPTGPLFPRGGGVSLSPDGRWLIYPQNDAAGIDLVMLENFR